MNHMHDIHYSGQICEAMWWSSTLTHIYYLWLGFTLFLVRSKKKKIGQYFLSFVMFLKRLELNATYCGCLELKARKSWSPLALFGIIFIGREKIELWILYLTRKFLDINLFFI